MPQRACAALQAKAIDAQRQLKAQGSSVLLSEIAPEIALEAAQDAGTTSALMLTPTTPGTLGQAPAEPVVQVSCALQVDGIRLVLINDLNGRAAPLVATTLRPLALMGSGTLAHMEVGGEVGMSVDMRNAGMSVWEPLLEPFKFDVTASLISGGASMSDVKLEAKKPCNLNLSSDMCGLLSSTVITLVEDVMGSTKVGALDEAFSPFTISNETGLVLRYGRSRAGTPDALLVPGDRQPFNFWPEFGDRLKLCDPNGPPPCALCLAFDGWNQVCRLPSPPCISRARPVRPWSRWFPLLRHFLSVQQAPTDAWTSR